MPKTIVEIRTDIDERLRELSAQRQRLLAARQALKPEPGKPHAPKRRGRPRKGA